MKSYGTAVYAGGGWGGSHVPLPTTPRPNRQRAERPSPIVLQPLTKAEERALERRSEKRAPKHHPGGNSNNPVGQEEARSYLAAYTAGQTIKAIARDHHRGAPTVRAHLVRQGATIRPPHNVTTARITDTERAEMIAKYRSGMSLKAVAAAHGRVHGTVLKILRDAGVPRRPEGGRTKVFTPEQQAHIVATYERTGSLHGAEAELNISAGTIAKVLDANGIDHSHRGGAPPLSAAEKARVRELAGQGMSMRKIGQAIGRSHSVVAKELREAK